MALASVSAFAAAAEKLQEKFNTIRVNREDFDHAKSVLDRRMDSWKENTMYDLTSGIAEKDLDEFGQLLIEQLGITEETEKKKIRIVCKMIKIAKGKESEVYILRYFHIFISIKKLQF